MSTMIPINYWAVLAAALFTIVLGYLWYGPLFGKSWMQHAGVAPASMKPGPLDLAEWIASAFLMAFGLAHVLTTANAYTHMSGVTSGLETGFWIWLSFVLPVIAGIIRSERKPPMLLRINAGYYLAALCGMGVILALLPAA
jgi:Protein of unknown function (DUF1761)